MTDIINSCIGAWRSPVAHLHGVQGVGGSNPLAPTPKTVVEDGLFQFLVFLALFAQQLEQGNLHSRQAPGRGR